MSRFVNKATSDEVMLENGDKVWVRQRLTAEEDAALTRSLLKLKVDVRSDNIEVEEVNWHLQKIHLCEAYLTGWDFRDDDGQPVTFDADLICSLDQDTVNAIAKAVDVLQKQRREEWSKKG